MPTAPRPKPQTVDEYFACAPLAARDHLAALRHAIADAAPDAQETLSYAMPAFRLAGILVYYAAFERHLGFYPQASAIEAFRAELTGFAVAKGTVRFLLDRPLPTDLIGRMVRFRVAENVAAANRMRRNVRRS